MYSISILYFDLGKGSDYLYVGQNDFVGVHTKDHLVISTKEEGAIVQRYPSEIFPTYYLVRVNNFNEVAKSPLEEWMRYLKEGVISERTTAPGLKEARAKLQYYSMTPAERYAYDEHINAVMIQNDVLGNAMQESRQEGIREGLKQGMKQGLKQGLEKGRAEGERSKAMAIARNLKLAGLSTEQIDAATGLTAEEVEKA